MFSPGRAEEERKKRILWAKAAPSREPTSEACRMRGNIIGIHDIFPDGVMGGLKPPPAHID